MIRKYVHAAPLRVAQVLAAARVPVVVLNACQSGAVGKELEAAVATRLLRGGAGSVVAMAYSVYAVAAAEFMAAFYERLFAGDTVSAAVTAGRQQLFRHSGRPSPKGELPLADWMIPVHYLRREVSFPGLVTARPAGEPSLEEALNRLRDPGRGAGGALTPVGVFTGRDALFFELETAARLQQRRLDEAADWYTRSAALNEELGNQSRLAMCYHQLGIVAQGRGQLDEAESWYTRAVAIREELGDRAGLAGSYHQVGMVAQGRGRLDEADGGYTRSLAIEEELGNRPGLATSYHQLGRVAQDRGRLDEAEDWYTRALAIREELGNRPGLALTFGQLGLLAEERGNLRQALEWTVRCVTVFEDFPHPSAGPGPGHLARLAHQLGMEVLEACWMQVTGHPLPGPVRVFVNTYRPDSGGGSEGGAGE